MSGEQMNIGRKYSTKKDSQDNLKSSFVLCTVPLTKAKLELLKMNIVSIKLFLSFISHSILKRSKRSL